MTPPKYSESQIESMLRQLTVDGLSLEDAVRELHVTNEIGILLLWRPVMNVFELSPIEAKRRLVRVLPTSCDPE